MRRLLFGLAVWLAGGWVLGGGSAAASTGSAFVVDTRGYLLTCAHVVQGVERATVALDGKTLPASVVAVDTAHDLALLRADAPGLPALPLGDSAAVRLGEDARACGYPLASILGSSLRVTRGSISAITTIGGKACFQVDAAINPGNSGGPLLNQRGEVVGVINAKVDAPGVEGVGFAVPINEARSMLAAHGVQTSKGGAGALDGPALAEAAQRSVALVRVEDGPARPGGRVAPPRQSLVGLPGVEVVAERDPDAERAGLTPERLRSDVEARLRQAGIRILTRADRPTAPGSPWLYVNVCPMRLKTGAYVYTVTLTLNQVVQLDREPGVGVFGATWNATGAIGYASAADLAADVRQRIADQVQEFTDAYRAANPGR